MYNPIYTFRSRRYVDDSEHLRTFIPEQQK